MQTASGAELDLAVVLEQLVRLMRQVSTVGGLSMPAASVLARLVREGPQRLTVLAGDEAVSQPAMTQLVTRLERDGLVRRRPDTDDRRVVLVEVTRTGRQLVERRRAERAAALRVLLDRLDSADRVLVTNALPALTRLTQLATAATLPPPRTPDTRGETA